jgi:hypothetical protein
MDAGGDAQCRAGFRHEPRTRQKLTKLPSNVP